MYQLEDAWDIFLVSDFLLTHARILAQSTYFFIVEKLNIVWVEIKESTVARTIQQLHCILSNAHI